MQTNKVVTAIPNGICVNYTDTKKHFFIHYEKKEMSNQIEKNFSSKNYQDEAVNLNPTQIKMYRLALYGVEALSDKELKNISYREKLNIRHKHEITQKLINRWKQQITQLKVNGLLSKLFPNSKLISDISSNSDYYCDGLLNYSSFKDLGISHQNVINKMIELTCLPNNFYQLK
jgi:hypothetical protein